MVGRQRDAQAVDISVYRAVLSTVAGKVAETRRHYGSMLIAIMNFGKAEGLISSHSPQRRAPPHRHQERRARVTWTKRELAIIMGPALEEWERGQGGAHIIKIVKMMGDTNVKTVEKHYFNFDDEMMADLIEGWEAPTLESLAQPLDMLDDSPELTN